MPSRLLTLLAVLVAYVPAPCDSLSHDGSAPVQLTRVAGGGRFYAVCRALKQERVPNSLFQ